jgi:23S rRNA pseudouridine955/2504/2580 synthase
MKGGGAVLQLVCDKDQTLKEFTDNNYAQASFFWAALIKNKEIKVNGKRVSSDMPLQSGDVVSYYLTTKQAEKPAFYTIYKDENLWIVDKESGVNSEAVFAALAREQECYFIHRLDRNTKGLLAFACKQIVAEEMLSAFKEKRVEKRYHALCFGKFEKHNDILTAYLKKDAEKSFVHVYDKQVAGSEKIVTEYRTLGVNERGLSKVEITLHTGKTHQIRAHLAHIGCPVVGDMKYGNSGQNKQLSVSRQCLIAKKLRFDFLGELRYLNEKQFISQFNAELL